MRSLHTCSLPVLLSAALLLSACGAPADAADAPAAEAAQTAASDDGSAAGASGAVGPIDNCGTEVRLEAPPERILTVKSTATELVLSLGLGDRLVGTAFSDGPLPDALAGATDAPEVSDGVPSQEVVLDLGPDLVFAGWESAFSADGVGERESLEEFGVHSYVAPAACQAAGHKPESLTFDAVFDDIREAGALLGAPEAADDLVAAQQELLDGVAPLDGEPTALWYSSGTDTPYVGAGSGAPQMMMAAAGMDNIAADVDDSWTSMSWEVIAERDPEVIVLVDADWNTAEDKIDRLESSAVTSQLSAVRSGSYLRVPFAASEAGVRNAEAVASLVRQHAEAAG